MEMFSQSFHVQDQFGFKRTFNISLDLDILKLLTKNHHSGIQNYLRNQFASNVNYDLVEQTIFLSKALSRELTPNNQQILIKCFETLTAMNYGPCK